MKVENIYISKLNKYITYYIGEDKYDNFMVIDQGSENDLWFHHSINSSCHGVCKIPENINRKYIRIIIKNGCLLCKQNTNSLKIMQDKIEFIYTGIKNVKKTEIPGSVIAINTKKFLL